MTKKTFFITILALVIIQFILIYPDKIGICSFIKNSGCVRGFFDSFYRDPLYVLSLSVLFSSVISLFVNSKVFGVWLKFTYIWVILSVIAIFITPDTTGNMIFEMDKEFISIIFSGLYTLISVFLIVTMSIIAHYKPQKRS